MGSDLKRKRERIGKIIAGIFFVPGAILASIGWAMNQALMEKGTTDMYDGFYEMIMLLCGVFLIIISLSAYSAATSFEEESQS